MRNIPDEISNGQDVIDSRDIIARIEYLTGLRDDFQNEKELPDFIDQEGMNPEDWAEWEDSEEGRELVILSELAEGVEGYSEDWQYGAALIRDSYFEDYARELAEDVGDMPKDVHWPFTCIDWAQAAEELQQDYTSVDFDGVEYWVR